jgi:type IV secretory pathway TraG/TraD family ATPase VirD4
VGAITSTLKRLLYETAAFSSALSAEFRSKSILHTARFAALHETADLSINPSFNNETSFLLGAGAFDRVYSVQPTRARRELGNLLVVAPTRGGKGILAVSQLLTWPHSVVVNDIKGDLFTQTAGYRSELGPVFVIDPTGIGNRYDPLAGKRTEDELFSAATQLLFRPDEGEGAIFAQRGAVMLTQILLAAGLEGVSALPYVRKLVRMGFPSCARYLAALSPDLATQFLDLEYNELNLNDRFLLSAWGTLSTRMRSVLLENVVRCFAGSDFTAEQIMCSEQPITVYLRWKEQDLLALAPLVRLIWGSLIDELITTYDKKQGVACTLFYFWSTKQEGPRSRASQTTQPQLWGGG